MNSTYYVLAADGNRYGPADLPTLQSWIDAQRLWPNTTLEEVGSSRRLRAVDLGGLKFPPTPAGQGVAAVAPSAVPPIHGNGYTNYAAPNAYSFGSMPMVDAKPNTGNLWGALGLGFLSLIIGYFVGFLNIFIAGYAIRMAIASKTDDEHPYSIPVILVVILLCGLGLYFRFAHRTH